MKAILPGCRSSPSHWPAETMKRPALLLALLLAAGCTTAQAASLRFSCRGWMPVYIDSWLPMNPEPGEFDSLSIDVDEASGTTSFVLTTIGRVSFPTRITDSQVKGTLALRRIMVDEMIETVDFSLKRGTGEVVVTALEKSRRPHLLYRGRCNQHKPAF